MKSFIIVTIALLFNSCGRKADWNGVWQCDTCNNNAVWAERICYHCHSLVAAK